MRCLAVTGETPLARFARRSDHGRRSGYKDFVFATDTVLLAPAKTPPETVKWLETGNTQGARTPEMKEKLFKRGFQVRPKGAKDAWARVTKEIDDVQRASSIRPA